jgi:hypothetical protein
VKISKAIRDRVRPVLDLFKRGRLVIHTGDLARLRDAGAEMRAAAVAMGRLANLTAAVRLVSEAERRRLERQALGIDEEEFREWVRTHPVSETAAHQRARARAYRGEDVFDAAVYFGLDPGGGDRTAAVWCRRVEADVHRSDSGVFNRDLARRLSKCAVCGYEVTDEQLQRATSPEEIGIVRREIVVAEDEPRVVHVEDGGRVVGFERGPRCEVCGRVWDANDFVEAHSLEAIGLRSDSTLTSSVRWETVPDPRTRHAAGPIGYGEGMVERTGRLRASLSAIDRERARLGLPIRIGRPDQSNRGLWGDSFRTPNGEPLIVHAADEGGLARVVMGESAGLIRCERCSRTWTDQEIIGSETLEAIGLRARAAGVITGPTSTSRGEVERGLARLFEDSRRLGQSGGRSVWPITSRSFDGHAWNPPDDPDARVEAALGDDEEPGESSSELAPSSPRLPTYRPR